MYPRDAVIAGRWTLKSGSAKLKEEVEGKSGNGKQGDLFGGVSDPAPGGIKPLESRMTGRRSVVLSGSSNVVELQTPKDKERELRDEIDKHVGAYARQFHVSKQHVNGHLVVMFNKARADMRLGELEEVQKYLKREMPVRKGYQKAQEIAVRWR